MKNSFKLLLCAWVSAWICSGNAFAANLQRAMDAGVRYHRDNSTYEALPFGDGDLSYSLGYEYHDQDYYVQLAAGYCPDVTGTNNVNYVITPEADLFLTDQQWEAGVGILNNFVSDDDKTNKDWTGIYWQLILGYTFPVWHNIPLNLRVFYPFKTWGDIGKFEARDLEYGAALKFSF